MTFVSPLYPLLLSVLAIFLCAAWGKLRPTSLQAGRYVSIDGLRGYLALFVFLHHAGISYFYATTGKWSAPPSNLLTHLGEASVCFFFMITAFLFYGKVLDNRERDMDWWKFFVARFLRLGPLYFVAFVALMVLVIFESKGERVHSYLYILKCVMQWSTFTIFGAPSVNNVDVAHMMAGVNWSLPYEWYFYLGMPLLALTGRVRVPWQYILLAVTMLAFAFSNGARLIFIAMFGGGVAAALLVRNPVFVRFAQRRIAAVLVLLCLAWLVVLFPTAYGLPQLLLLTVAFSLISGGSNLFGILSIHPARFLGELSYGIYLLHGIVLFISLKYLIGYDEVKSMSAAAYWSVIGGLVPVVLFIAAVAFHKIEYPAMQCVPWVTFKLRALQRRLFDISIDDPLKETARSDLGR